MKKLFRFIGLFLIVFVLIAAVIKAVLFYKADEKLKTYTLVEKIKTFLHKPLPQKQASPPAKMPDLQVLASLQLNPQAPLSLSQNQEEKQITHQQVTAAKNWLSNANAEQRQIAVEQLSAYPTPDAEKMLINALSDKDFNVRSAAGASLAAFNTLSQPAIIALLAAIDDNNETVQLNVLSTLQKQIAKEQKQSIRYQIIMQGIKQKEHSSHFSTEMREVIHGFIEEQQEYQ
jgi:hypothetical protein